MALVLAYAWLLCLGILSRGLGQVFFYEETCDADAFNSGIDTNAAQFLRKNIVRMETCVSAPDTPLGMAEIFHCETGRGEVFLTSTLYTRGDCLETEVADDGTYAAAFGGLPGETNRQLFTRYYDLYYSDCTSGQEQLTVGTRFQCVHNPAWMRDPTWLGAVGYDMWPDTAAVEACPVNRLPTVRAYSTTCVKMGIGEPDSRLYTVVGPGDDSSKPSNQSSMSQMTYPSGFCECETENAQTCNVNPYDTKVSAIGYSNRVIPSDDDGSGESPSPGPQDSGNECGVVRLLNYSSETNEMMQSPGYLLTNGSLIESPWGKYSAAEAGLVKPPIDVRALLIIGGIVCGMCCGCLVFLGYSMNKYAAKAEEYDGRETEVERNTVEDRWISRDVTFIVEKPKMYTNSGSLVSDTGIAGLTGNQGGPPRQGANYEDEFEHWQRNHSGEGQYSNQVVRSDSIISSLSDDFNIVGSPSRRGSAMPPSRNGSMVPPSRNGSMVPPSRNGSMVPPSRNGSMLPDAAGASRKVSFGGGGIDSPMHRRGSMQPTQAQRKASIAVGGGGIDISTMRKVGFASAGVVEGEIDVVSSPSRKESILQPQIRRGSIQPQSMPHERKESTKPEKEKETSEERKARKASVAHERKKSHSSHSERRKTKEVSMIQEEPAIGVGATMGGLGGIAEDDEEDDASVRASTPEGDAPIEDKPFFPHLRKASVKPPPAAATNTSRRKTKMQSMASEHAVL